VAAARGHYGGITRISQARDRPPPPPMEYESTRGGDRVGLRTAVLEGLARDGGLYVPERLPRLGGDTLDGIGDARPLELASEMMAPFLEADLSPAEVAGIVERALDLPAPLTRLDDATDLLGLWHGPTLAFKDFGARFMAEVLDALLARDGSSATVLVATSGDTGGAVASAFGGRPRIRVVLLFPRGRVSEVQRLQLTADAPGAQACEVDGTFDDCQRVVKEAFADRALSEEHALTSANSINVARWLPQATYFGALGAALARRGGPPPDVCVVPSGNLGDVTSGVLAARMGVPLPRFVVATNANDAAVRFLRGDAAPGGPAVRTLSNAMDVAAPSNLERLRALFPGDDDLRAAVDGRSVDDAATLAAMRETAARTGVVVDPHTACGLAALDTLRRERGAGLRGVVLSTAHPAKFPRALEAAGVRAPLPQALAGLAAATRPAIPLEPSLAALRGVLRAEPRP